MSTRLDFHSPSAKHSTYRELMDPEPRHWQVVLLSHNAPLGRKEMFLLIARQDI